MVSPWTGSAEPPLVLRRQPELIEGNQTQSQNHPQELYGTQRLSQKQETPEHGQHGLYKTEVIRKKGPWKNLEAVEAATLEWVSWFNNKRLLEPLGYMPPAEFETAYYNQLEDIAIGL